MWDPPCTEQVPGHGHSWHCHSPPEQVLRGDHEQEGCETRGPLPHRPLRLGPYQELQLVLKEVPGTKVRPPCMQGH